MHQHPGSLGHQERQEEAQVHRVELGDRAGEGVVWPGNAYMYDRAAEFWSEWNQIN